MDRFLRSTDNPDIPDVPPSETKGYNGERVNALADMEALSKRPIFKHAAQTMKNRSYGPGNELFAAMVPPEMSAFLNLSNQICSSCHIKEAPLFTCSCCSIVQVCSKACLRDVQEHLSDHKEKTHRFVVKK